MAKHLFGKKEKKEDVGLPLERLQAERIEELKRENNRLSIELAKYRARESEITEAMAFAKKKAKELEQEANARYALEWERLESYRRKWTGAVQNLEKAESLGEQVIKTERYLRQCAQELKEIINKDIPFDNPPQTDYYKETARLTSRCGIKLGGLDDFEEKEPSEEASSISDEELEKLVRQVMDTAIG